LLKWTCKATVKQRISYQKIGSWTISTWDRYNDHWTSLLINSLKNDLKSPLSPTITCPLLKMTNWTPPQTISQWGHPTEIKFKICLRTTHSGKLTFLARATQTARIVATKNRLSFNRLRRLCKYLSSLCRFRPSRK
jgi:hypothetical protein